MCKENTGIDGHNFTKVLNRDAEAGQDHVEKFDKKPVVEEVGTDVTFEELHYVSKKMC